MTRLNDTVFLPCTTETSRRITTSNQKTNLISDRVLNTHNAHTRQSCHDLGFILPVNTIKRAFIFSFRTYINEIKHPTFKQFLTRTLLQHLEPRSPIHETLLWYTPKTYKVNFIRRYTYYRVIYEDFMNVKVKFCCLWGRQVWHSQKRNT